jgi:Ca2+-binding RTX toxin-like protein
MANITGTHASETLNGTTSSDTISGLGGSDLIDALGGADTIFGGEGADTLRGGDGNDTIYGHSTADLNLSSGNIGATLLANVGSGAVFATGAPGDNGFLYALKKDAGQIIRINTTTGAQSTFLDIPDGQLSSGQEQGVLCVAFHPGYATNGRLFAFLTNAAGDIQLREYARLPGDPPTADPVPVKTIITIPHPDLTVHNGNALAFGPDGYLYMSTGDGGGFNDPNDNAQNNNVLLGKILRIDVNGDDFPADPSRNYAIPADNPFAGATPGADEIWASGLRNPWRISFDSLTGDLYIADVGASAREEVNFDAAGGPGGLNYGWDYREGTLQGPTPPPNPPIAFTDPVFDYPRDFGRSVTGGYVYHGLAPGLQGAYFFADFITGRLVTLRVVNGVAEDAIDHRPQVVGATLSQISSFGTDNSGNLYVVTLPGAIYRLNPGVAAGDGADTIEGGAGNDKLFGGEGNDILNGDAGADSLHGGARDDIMRGGADNDIYVVNNTNDTVDESVAGSSGLDTVQSAISFSLSNTARILGAVENLTLTGSAKISGTGNALNNGITGNADRNTLTGLDGDDTLNGGGANDTLNGGNGNDRLDGGGGGDNMRGGAGNDLYLVNSVNDIINESLTGSSGVDTVESSISFSLGNTARVLGAVENLRLLGSSAINGTGNVLGNGITGNTGSNFLDGQDGNDILDGGLGNDSLTGGAGNDAFFFNTALSAATNIDDLVDFSVPADTVRLENSVFTALTTTGTLAAAAFHIGGAAHDADDRIIYDSTAGTLTYDSNGNAAGGAVQFATLDPGLLLTNADFEVV